MQATVNNDIALHSGCATHLSVFISPAFSNRPVVDGLARGCRAAADMNNRVRDLCFYPDHGGMGCNGRCRKGDFLSHGGRNLLGRSLWLAILLLFYVAPQQPSSPLFNTRWVYHRYECCVPVLWRFATQLCLLPCIIKYYSAFSTKCWFGASIMLFLMLTHALTSHSRMACGTTRIMHMLHRT